MLDRETLRRRLLQPAARHAGRLVLPGRAVLDNRYLSGKLLPLAPDEPHALLLRAEPGELHEGLPVPPQHLWERWASTLDGYLQEGRGNVERMLASLAEAGVGVDSLGSVLDFGCAEARMLRFLPGVGERNLWGVDVNAERIAWCQLNLQPPLRFATTTTAPHLPFGDDSFDLAYGISVFTHISELADAWLLELLRVVRPDGHLYLTIHDEHTLELLGEPGVENPNPDLAELVDRFDRQTGALARDWVYFAVHADPGAQVFYRRDALLRRWSQLADVRAVEQEAIGYQTALLLRKTNARPPRASAPAI